MTSEHRRISMRFTDQQIDDAMGQLAGAQRILDYDTKEFTVEHLVSKFRPVEGEPDIYIPDYQRRFNWEQRRQSRFIESVLLGLPIPFLFFAEADQGRYEVVDGMQRLSTCTAFLRGELELVGLEKLDMLDGFSFSDLTAAQQRKFRNRSIRSVVLSDKASPSDRRDLFDRINTGSLVAEPSEVRRGSIGGSMTDLIDELAKDPGFLQICPITEAAQRSREGEELVTRLFAFGDGLVGYNDRIREFLDSWLKVKNKEAAADVGVLAEYRQRFQRVVSFITANFPNGFRKTPKARTAPRVRFDSLSVGAHLALTESPELAQSGPSINPTTWLDSDDFLVLTTSGGANVQSKIENRIYYVKHMLLGQEELAKSWVPGYSP